MLEYALRLCCFHACLTPSYVVCREVHVYTELQRADVVFFPHKCTPESHARLNWVPAEISTLWLLVKTRGNHHNTFACEQGLKMRGPLPHQHNNKMQSKFILLLRTKAPAARRLLHTTLTPRCMHAGTYKERCVFGGCKCIICKAQRSHTAIVKRGAPQAMPVPIKESLAPGAKAPALP